MSNFCLTCRIRVKMLKYLSYVDRGIIIFNQCQSIFRLCLPILQITADLKYHLRFCRTI